MVSFSTLPRGLLLLLSFAFLSSLPAQTTISGWAKIHNSGGQALADVVITIPAEPQDVIVRTGADGRFELAVPEAYVEIGMVPIEAARRDHYWINRREARLQHLGEAAPTKELILVFYPDLDYRAAVENFSLDLHPVLDKKYAVVQTRLREKLANQPADSTALKQWLERINRWRGGRTAVEAANFLFPIDFDQATAGQKEAHSALLDGRIDEAIATIIQEVKNTEQQAGVDPKTLSQQYQFAAQLAFVTGEIGLGQDCYLRAIAAFESPEVLLDYADFLSALGDTKEAERQLLALLERTDLQAETKAEVHAKLTNNYQWQQIPVRSILHARLALDIHQELATQFPQLEYFQDKLAQSHGRLGRQLAANENNNEALTHHALVYEHTKTSLEQHPTIRFEHYDFATSCLWYGEALAAVGQKRQAKRIFSEGLAVIQPIADRSAYSIYQFIADVLADKVH